jgi:peptidoglycan/xylan/chitin deacetylase (PgdA/CDA1 family)
MQMTIKPLLKRGGQIAAAGFGRHRWPPRRGELLILTYHRILPPDDPHYAEVQPGMVVHPETFRMHLKVIKDYFEPVSLADWVDRATSGRSLPRRACAVTLDDGWRDNYEHAYTHLCEEVVPATIFLVSDYVDTVRSFWPERLARLVRALVVSRLPPEDGSQELAWFCRLGVTATSLLTLMDRECLDAIIVSAKRFSDEELNTRLDIAFAEIGLRDENRDILCWSEVLEMHSSGLVNFGSHTRTHTRLRPDLDPDEAIKQIRESRETIESRLGSSVKLFCYPNGDMTDEAERVVRTHYLGACTTEKGWNRASTDLYRLQRIGLHQDMSADPIAFLAKISGFF